jgi:hypothetical protein
MKNRYKDFQSPLLPTLNEAEFPTIFGAGPAVCAYRPLQYLVCLTWCKNFVCHLDAILFFFKKSL